MNCWWEASFVNTVLGLLLGESLGSESVHRKEIHTLFPVTDGNTRAAPQHCCKSKHLQRGLWSCASLYEMKTWPTVSSQLSDCVGIHFGLLFLFVFLLLFFKSLAACLGNIGGHLGHTASATAQVLSGAGHSHHVQKEEWDEDARACATIQPPRAHAAKSTGCI